MPTDVNLRKEEMIYQREQYKKRGISRRYWDFKDSQLIKPTARKQKIVDIGCGEGILLEKLSKLYPEKYLLGIDFEKENIKICKKQNLNVQFGSVYDLQLKNNSFDCVIFSEVIEYLKQPQKAIGEIQRILKKDGLLILLFPNDKVFKITRILTLMIKEAFYDTGHTRQWTPKKIRTLLNNLKFEISEQKNIPFKFWQLSLHHLVIAKKL